MVEPKEGSQIIGIVKEVLNLADARAAIITQGRGYSVLTRIQVEVVVGQKVNARVRGGVLDIVPRQPDPADKIKSRRPGD